MREASAAQLGLFHSWGFWAAVRTARRSTFQHAVCAQRQLTPLQKAAQTQPLKQAGH